MPRTAKQIASKQAQLSIALSECRVSGMRLRASLDRPTAAIGKFPYPHRTCDQWMDFEMTDEERERDAREGSEMLRVAILAARG